MQPSVFLNPRSRVTMLAQTLVLMLTIQANPVTASDLDCPQTPLPLPESGLCTVTAGNAALRLQGDVLTPDGILGNGQVVVGSDGVVACVGCDCSAHPDYANATRIECPEGVISPGLIDSMQRISFSHNPPADDSTGERYDHRHQWRLGLDGHTSISASGGGSTNQKRWIELRALLAGTTTINGSGNTPGFTRNLDLSADAIALGVPRINNSTFPLGDSSGTRLTGSCAYNSYPVPTADTDVYVVGDGTDASARNEFICITGQANGGSDVLGGAPALGLVGLTAADATALVTRAASVVWTPRYNTRLYGDPGPATLYDNVGLQLLLASNWTPTGSMNLLRELSCADQLNQVYFDQQFSDRDLWEMVTQNPADNMGWGTAIGRLAVGHVADIAIFNARVRVGHRAVIEASVTDVALVLKSGVPMTGHADLMTALGQGSCESIPANDACGVEMKVCVSRETEGATDYSALAAANASSYPLFFCGTPVNEPTCTPQRSSWPEGIPIYTGTVTAGDLDGDGVANAEDNCPTIFNPARPVDDGIQANADGDDFGDACDPCPLVNGFDLCHQPLIFLDGFES